MELKMICFNGFNYTVIESGATFADMKKLVERRRSQGYEVTRLSPFEAEVNSDEFLINDFMGYLKLTKEQN